MFLNSREKNGKCFFRNYWKKYLFGKNSHKSSKKHGPLVFLGVRVFDVQENDVF